MKKVAFYTLGCKLNFSETSSIMRMFQQHSYQKVEFYDSPDIIVVNTCSVTDNADRKCRQVVKEAKKASHDPYIIIIGCYAQLKPQEIAEIPGVDAVLGASEKFRLIELLDGFEKHPKTRVYASDIAEATTFNNAYSLNDRTRTFLKVQDGCDYSCSFCTIPLARGKSRSDTIENVVKSARDIAANEVKEIVLTGVNTGDFGIRNGQRQDRFIDLITALDLVEGIERIRISSIEPNLLTPEIVDFVANSKLFVPHFHIPLQSGSDKMLRQMRRRYLSDLYVDRVAIIKKEMPHCCIGVDVIVGFPGESHEDFLETYRFLNELDISYLHVFTYSERANTQAIELGEIVPMKERNNRSKMLRSLSEKKRRYFYDQFVGKTLNVLFEKDIEGGKIHGFTDNYIRVAVDFDPEYINQLMMVKMVKSGANGIMQGEVVNSVPAQFC
ncbi:MAG: tRNA (N(6)-L-threonylcarbamoyladenosine(37)-C(2))-methylthiotransferase MtaB [Cyclobacteriaceae bacterium]|nr:tRNA (N(6)-L-threonylcarbamoyladenosine(37)-C(2))-methylthiotransferase MtaB [Cyclobacteriaceae bacterium]